MEEDNAATKIDLESSRRRFLIWATGILTFLCGALVGMPLTGSFIGPAFRTTKTRWISVADIGTLPLGQPVNLKIVDMRVDAYVRESAILHLWAVKHSDAEVTVFSPVCTHLGCRYAWNPVSAHFECPCHGSIYAPDGAVLGGPAPRRLDTLATRIENGRLSVDWKQFRSGIPEKIPV